MIKYEDFNNKTLIIKKENDLVGSETYVFKKVADKLIMLFFICFREDY